MINVSTTDRTRGVVGFEITSTIDAKRSVTAGQEDTVDVVCEADPAFRKVGGCSIVDLKFHVVLFVESKTSLVK